MSEDTIELTRRKVLAAMTTVGGVSAGAGLGTNALFSDEERVGNNRLVAGQLDVRVGWESYYFYGPATAGLRREQGVLDNGSRVGLPGRTNGTASVSLANESQARAVLNDSRVDGFPAGYDPLTPPESPCPDGLGDADQSPPVIELADVKPGDFGSAVLDFALCDNPGFVWLRGRLRAAEERGVTEPESDADAETGGTVELLDAVRALVWIDDGDGIQTDEPPVVAGTLRQVVSALASGQGIGLSGDADAEQFGGRGRNCFTSGTTHSVVFAWRVPTTVGNEIQSDRAVFDLGLYAEQCRHNAASGGNASYLPQAKLFPETGEEDDQYGRAVAVSGDTAMVGAPNGSVFVLERNDGGWQQTQRLETGAVDEFGTSIDINGDASAALISAPGADVAYVYTPTTDGGSADDDETWARAVTLDPGGDPTAVGYESVAIAGGTAVVSGYEDAYVFERSSDGWSNGATGPETLATADGLPAAGLALDGETLLLGAPAVTGFRSGGPGKVYVYENDGDWGRTATLEPDAGVPDAYQDFGASVALDGDTALVGAPRAGSSGATHVYERNGGWRRVATLTPLAATADARFGDTSTLTGDTALIGAPADDGDATDAGAAYVFDGTDGWAGNERQRLAAPEGAEGDAFGTGVALSSSATGALVGARRADGGETDAGAVFVFTT